MRYILALIAFLAYVSPALGDTFLTPTLAAYVNYGDSVAIEIKVAKPVLGGKIVFGRSMAEASRIVLKSAIQEYGDTLRALVIMPQFYPADDPKDRDYRGWARFWLLDNLGGSLADVQVQVGEPPTTGVGKVSRPMYRPRPGRFTSVNIMGRNSKVTSAFFWRYPHAH
jgi:hypothetical protein